MIGSLVLPRRHQVSEPTLSPMVVIPDRTAAGGTEPGPTERRSPAFTEAAAGGSRLALRLAGMTTE